MQLTSERLILRLFLEKDLTYLISYAIRPEFFRYLPIENQSAKDVEIFFNERMAEQRHGTTDRFTFAVALKQADRIIGTVRLGVFDGINGAADLGYAMDSDFEGNGYMSEAVRVVLQHAFDSLSIKELWAISHKDNIKSRNLLTRLGMTPAKAAPKGVQTVGAPEDQKIYRTTLKGFKQADGAQPVPR